MNDERMRDLVRARLEKAEELLEDAKGFLKGIILFSKQSCFLCFRESNKSRARIVGTGCSFTQWDNKSFQSGVHT